MNVTQQWLEACRNLIAFHQRASLAMLGIGVGSALVVALLMLGKSAQQMALSAFDNLGGDIIVVDIGIKEDSHSPVPLLPVKLDLSVLSRVHHGIRRVVPVARWNTSLPQKGDENGIPLMVIGSTPDLMPLLGLTLTQGRAFSRYDSRSTYAIVSADLASRLSGSASARTFLLGHYAFDVIGALKSATLSIGGQTTGHVVLVPIETITRISPFATTDLLYIQVTSTALVTPVVNAIRPWLEQMLPTRTIQIQIQQQIIDSMAQQNATFRYLLAALAAVALLMGGIGVMNVMVMSVSMRRHEIGLRQAIGARSLDIGVLFLLEAALLSLPGAVLGSVAGALLAWAYTRYADWPLMADPWVFPLAIGSALVLAVFFGLKPSLTAARLSPAEALREH
ncbi:Macrolide export ATP-binding/permease protein MacB [Dickeya dianthicola]|uniref:ABC transporter permease n=1 Tax=Dickeya dianthicola TaxID=204039 RepID=A0ABX9NLD5_9GAMM|nr:ABC transporter permease [Dickeya dianthicola]ATO32732.1 Macrolide export ATP-binding/permease protein MacB [Dickeya dianthicola RNS04.9]AYC18695.1 Macrolide export ATP-binding/permease protein MacB [Dickeya dianthicola]MBI0437234.1 ABC transporter permease [Dickeya dianthicola]MBI0449468.1 ABC transporter permease [Dickeya dianthicola]MBI0453957.1 ABC transporter permease [Dickeya dianthicola]